MINANICASNEIAVLEYLVVGRGRNGSGLNKFLKIYQAGGLEWLGRLALIGIADLQTLKHVLKISYSGRINLCGAVAGVMCDLCHRCTQ